MKRPARTLTLLPLGLVGLFLLVVCAQVGGPPPAGLREAVQPELGPEGGLVGPVGLGIGRVVLWAVGPWLQWLLPLLPFAALPWLQGREHPGRTVLQALGALVAAAGLLAHPVLEQVAVPAYAGGALGRGVQGLAQAIIGSVGSFLVLAGLALFLVLRWLPPIELDRPDPAPLRAAAARARVWLREAWLDLRGWGGEQLARLEELRPRPSADGGDEAAAGVEAPPGAPPEREPVEAASAVPEPAPPVPATNGHPPAGSDDDEFRLSRDPSELLEEGEAGAPRRRRKRSRGKLPLPGLELLQEIRKEERGFTREALQMKARQLLETLQNFGIEGQINEIRPGPIITTFEFQPAAGVKVNQITSRTDDLALAMEAIRIRIVAPIPGKAAVGIEIPNPYPQVVGLREVVEAIEDDPRAQPLSIALGKDTEGKPFLADLADMPHLLVAGATGSGKSVCINAIICNLLLRNGPDRVKLVMVDPKMLELSVYNGIPHLMHPVITDAREALKAVKWMVSEMTVRYNRLSKHGVRNIGEYNDKVAAGKVVEPTGEKVRDPLPFVVLIIDELADLMMQLGSELETPIARLAQMARAVGIHLVLATQRPSVNVITGIIKANFPSRIGFRVISKVDSRTILDANGAEHLLGKGDMLCLLAGMPQPVRVHGAYLGMEECEAVVEHWKPFAEEEPPQLELDQGNGPGGVDIGEDDLLDEARRMVVLSQSGSTTMLQRRLRVGYTRASRLMDMLEAEGVVGPFEGSKARKVLVEKESLEGEA